MLSHMSAADKQMLSRPGVKLLIDEADLLSPHNRDAIASIMRLLNPSVQIFEVGDPMQGKPYLNADEGVTLEEAVHLGARKELTIEGEFMQNSARAVVMLRQTALSTTTVMT